MMMTGHVAVCERRHLFPAAAYLRRKKPDTRLQS